MVADSRAEPPHNAGEIETLEGFLEYQRGTVLRKVTGLSEADARQRLVPSLLTAAGVVKHLADVEKYWFEEVILGRDIEMTYSIADPDGDWRVEHGEWAGLIGRYRAACERSRQITATLDPATTVLFKGEPLTARWVMTHMIEETARHAGHLDIVRELLDGQTGE